MGPFDQQNPYTGQQSFGNNTLYGGAPLFRNQFFDFGGFPGLGGNSGFALQAMLQPLIAQFMGNMGFMPAQFQPTQNLFDQQRMHNMFMQNMMATQQASMVDKNTYERMLRGVANVTGTRFGIEQFTAAQGIAGDISNISPMMAAMAPEFFDQLHGLRGSNQVMAHYLHLGGRYARDPVTGLTGLSGDTASAYSRQIFNNLYGEGANIGSMRGIGAGEAGRMYDELNRRGFMGAAMQGPGSPESLVEGEGSRISQRLKSLAGAVSAMRDIFGDAGHPNAPIPEIISGLQALTQGGLASMDPGTLESTVRKTYNLSRMSGMSMNSMSQLIGTGAAFADQNGLDRQFALQATQGAVAFATAYGQFGRGDLAYFGKPDKDRLTILDQRLRETGALSPMAVMLNAAAYIGDTMNVTPGSQAEAFIGAVKGGQTSYGYGFRTFSTAQSQMDFMGMMEQGGVGRNVTANLLASGAGLQQYGLKYNVSDQARRLQLDTDVKPFLLSNVANIVQNEVGGRVGAQQSNAMTQAGINAALSMPEDAFADPNGRIRAIASAMSGSSGGKYTMEELIPLAGTFVPRFDTAISTSPFYRGYGNFAALRTLQSPMLTGRALDVQREAQAEADLQTAFSTIGRMGPLRRMSEMLISKDFSSTGIGELVAEALGGIPESQVQGAARTTLNDQLTQLGGLAQQYHSADPAKRAELLKRMSPIFADVNNALGKFYAADVAVTGAMAEDLAKMGRSGDVAFLHHFGNIAQMMLENNGNLEQLGTGSPAELQKSMGLSNRLNQLIAKSGGTATQFMQQLLAEGQIDGLSPAEASEARVTYKMMQEAATSFDERIRNGIKATGDKTLTETDRQEAERVKQLLKTSTDTPSTIIQSLAGILGTTVTGDAAGFIKADPSRGVRIGLAMDASKVLRSAATRYGIDSKKSISEIISMLSDPEVIGYLSPKEKQALMQAAPLGGLDSLGLSSESLEKAFPSAPKAGAGTGVEKSTPKGPGKIDISGRVKFEFPNWLVFEDTHGREVPTPGGNHPRHDGVNVH